MFGDKGLQPLGLLSDLPSHAIVDRGRVVGLWEYDPSTESIVWSAFVEKDKALSDAVARMQTYVRDELGDARSFSLDSPKSRAPRIEALRKAVYEYDRSAARITSLNEVESNAASACDHVMLHGGSPRMLLSKSECALQCRLSVDQTA